MSRSQFGTWGLELSPDDFACALAALGVWQARYRGYLVGGRQYKLAEFIDALDSENGLTAWQLDYPPEMVVSRYMDPNSASQLCELWKQVLAGREHPIRLLLKTTPEIQPLQPWLLETLNNPAVGGGPVTTLEEEEHKTGWHWPVQIGFLEHFPYAERFRSLPPPTWSDVSLASFKFLPGEGESCDLLILPWSLSQAVAEMASQPGTVKAACLILLGNNDLPWRQAQAYKTSLLETCQADGLYCLNLAENLLPQWIERCIFHFSHNQPIDLVFQMALKDLLPPAIPPRLFFASHWLLTQSSLQALTESMGENLKIMADTISIDLPDSAAIKLNLEPGLRNGKDLSQELMSHAVHYSYNGESHEASGIAALANIVDDAEKNWARETAQQRWLQSKVSFMDEGKRQQPLQKGFIAGQNHVLEIRIGPEDAEWLTPPQEAVFPDWELPSSTQTRTLKVVFSEPNHSPTPQIETIALPQTGPSSTCHFYFKIRTDRPFFRGRILVLHRNRLLQTAILQGPVIGQNQAKITGPGIQLGIEAVLRPNLAGLKNRRRFDAALLTNHTPQGEALLTEISGDQVRIVSLEGLNEVIKNIRKRLQKIADNPNDFPPDLYAKGTVNLLRYLALQGCSLYEFLVNQQIGSQPLAKARRIQVVSATQNSFLPLEFVYDRPAPALDSKLCSQALQALEKGSCAACLQDATVPNPILCPLGFWGLTRVIERHTNKPGEMGKIPSGQFDLKSEPYEGRNELPPLAAALYAASNRVDSEKPGLIQSVLDTLDQVTNHKASKASTWSEWLDQVKTNNPSLLVLLAHSTTDRENDLVGLEIGESEQLYTVYMQDEHVHSKLYARRPIVLLLGCDTMGTIPFQSFIAEFRSHGAAMVVGTASAVRGRHAAPVANMLVEVFDELVKQKPFTFGEAMLKLRCKALSKGIPMVLTLFPYGDADWRLTAA
jgi:hypothetical protein